MPYLLDADFTTLNQLVFQLQPSKIFILVDENTHEHCLPLLLGNLETISPIEILEVAAGEEMKTLETAAMLWEILLEFQADRQALVLNLGGGVVTDLGGFVASVFKRGLNFANIPTSLLGMVDAATGGKTGVDFHHIKNVLGTFTMPLGVYLYPEFLKTLPHLELISGLGEMAKHALIADAALWKELISLSEYSAETLGRLVARSVEIKEEIVKMDPMEKTIRRNLNFGHTLGHAIESYLLKQGRPIPHGVAVAWGMKQEAGISNKLGLLSAQNFEEISSQLNRIFGEYWKVADNISSEHLWPYLLQDKKNEDNKIGFVFLDDIGRVSSRKFIELEDLKPLL